MNDDKRIQELFDSFTPALKDNELFNKRLERKFAMIDEIQQAETKQIRRYRMAVVAAFVAGIVLGSGLLTIQHTPVHFRHQFLPATIHRAEQSHDLCAANLADDSVLHHCHDEYQRDGEQNKRQGNVTKQENRDAPFDVDNFLYDNSTLISQKTVKITKKSVTACRN